MTTSALVPSRVTPPASPDCGSATWGGASPRGARPSEIREAFRAVGAVAKHRRTGEWTCELRTTEPITEREIRQRLESVDGARVFAVREFPAQWRAERRFVATVVIRDRNDVADAPPNEMPEGFALGRLGGLLPTSEGV